MNATLCWVCRVGLAMLISVGAANAEEAMIGTIKTLKGGVSVVRNGAILPAATGMGLMVADKIVTGADSSAGISLQDATLMSLGAKSATQLDRFRYDPVKREGNMLVSIIKGSMRFVTGLLGKQDPSAVGIRTPTATIGMRGTDFIVSVADKE